MNKYLLLRDNKQSGPYTCEEIQAKGIKAYDLVWIDGKSAAWRYPSEVEELKPFSPVIEEQPFERFYKKPAEDTSDVRSRKEDLLQPVKSEPVVKKIDTPPQVSNPVSTPKKIYINFPAITRNTNPETPSAGVKETEKPLIKSTPVVPSVQQSEKSDLPVTKSFPASTNREWKPDGQLRTSHEKYPVAHKPANRPILSILAAACVLLIGVVIGLIYSYNSSTLKQRELEKLVAQMKTSNENAATITENQNNQGTQPIEDKQTDNDLPAETAGVLQNSEPLIVSENLIEKKNPVAPQKTKKSSGELNTKSKSETNIASGEPIVIPAINTEEEKPRTDLLEQNRKNIFQKVSIENNKFKTGVLGGINDLQLTLTNKSMFQLEQVEVEVRYLGSENRVVKTQTVYFTNVSPGEKLSLKVPKSTRGIAVEYSVKKISTKELGMASAG